MQAGELVGGDVRTYTSRVVVAGVEREHVSWSTGRELSGDLPAQVVAGSGLSQASGTIVWSEGDTVVERPANPWNASSGWLPARGDSVVIWCGDGVTEWRQFTGIISDTTGSLKDGAQSSIVDRMDDLDVRVSHEPLLRIMPPLVEADPYRGIGLSSIHYVDHALREAGFYVVPKTEYDAAVAVSCQGSMWPNAGKAGVFKSGGGYTLGASHSSNHPAPWGWAAGNFNVTYAPRVSYPSSRVVQLSVMVAPDHVGEFFLTAYYGSNNVQLAVTTGRVVILRVNGTESCRITLGAGTLVAALVKGGNVTLRTNGGAQSAGTGTIGGATMSSVITSGTGAARVAGIQVSHPVPPSYEFASINFVPNARYRLDYSQLIGLMDAAPAIEGKTARELLTEISDATLTAMWIDEYGVFQWAPSDGLRAQTSMQEVSTLNDILELAWSDDLLGGKSRVGVDALIPAIDKGRYWNRIMYQGGGDDLSAGDEKVEFIGPDDDTDWIMPDENPRTIDSGAAEQAFNAGRGSFFGAVYASDLEPVDKWAQSYVTFGLERIAARTWKLTHKVSSSLPDGAQVRLQTAVDPDLWPRWREFNLMVLRGPGVVKWATIRRDPIGVGGAGSELIHDCGVWNNRTDDNTIIDRVGTFIASQVTDPRPVITGLGVVFDPRRQLGDVITIASPHLLGVTLTALVVGADSEMGDTASQSLTVRIIDAVTEFTTYAEYNKALPGASLTYTQWDALGPKPHTYTQFNTAE